MLKMEEEQNLIETKNKNSELAAPVANNHHKDLKSILDPPTKLPIACFEVNERSFIKDRKWVGKRTVEIVEQKYGGYDRVTNKQLSQATKQAWDERIAVCQALTQDNKASTEVTETPEPTKNTVKTEI